MGLCGRHCLPSRLSSTELRGTCGPFPQLSTPAIELTEAPRGRAAPGAGRSEDTSSGAHPTHPAPGSP